MGLKDGDSEIRQLYKYQPDKTHTLDLLRKQELYFSFSKDFNDPFDCRVNLLTVGSKSQWAAHAKKYSITDEVFNQSMKFLKSINFDADKLRKLHDKMSFNKIILYCLSEIRNNILMWSHYANSHKGICIGFETIIDQNSLCIKHNDTSLNNHPIYKQSLAVDKVAYQENYPEPYAMFSSNFNDLWKFFTTKSDDWEYEKERRIVLAYPEINKRIIHYDKSALKEVVFGCKTSDDFKEKVTKVINDEYISKGYDIDILQCSINREEYRLNITKIN